MNCARLGTVIDRNHCESQIELLFRFFAWMQAEGLALRTPTRAQTAERFHISKNTAWRWRRAYFAAIGKPIPPSAATDSTTAAPAPRISP